MKRVLIVLIFIVGLVTTSSASHLMGGEITWECLSTGKVRFIMKLYNDCTGNPGLLGATEQIQINNYPSVGQFRMITMTRQSITEVRPDCDGVTLDCSNQDAGSLEEYVYWSDPFDFSESTNKLPPPEGWILTYDDCCRNGAIVNLVSPDQQGMTVRSVMYNYKNRPMFPCFDSSPDFSEKPSAIVCAGSDDFTYNHNASDRDLGDSLAFKFEEPLNQFAGNFNYPANPGPLSFTGGYTAMDPLPGNSTISEFTGETTFTPSVTGQYETVVKVESWKDGILVAEVIREIQVIITTCGANDAPTVSAPFPDENGSFTEFNDTVRAGDFITFRFSGVDIGENLTIQASGAQLSVDGNPNSCINGNGCAQLTNPPPFIAGDWLSMPDSVYTNFYWQTNCDHVSESGSAQTYIYVIRIKDNSCPVPKERISTIAITVLDFLPVEGPQPRCSSVDENGDVTVTWDQPVDTTGKFNSYHLFSSTDINGPYTAVDSIFDYNQLSYTHSGAGATGDTVFYYMRSRSGCSGQVWSSIKDTIASVKLNAVFDNTDHTVDLTWNAPFEPLLASSETYYKVYREFPIGTWTLIDSTQALAYTDTTQNCADSTSYYVTLDDNTGCTTKSSTIGLTYQNIDPVANFTTSVNPCAIDTTFFIDGSTANVGLIASWEWDFGDASGDNIQSPWNIYSSPGVYNPQLVVTDEIGCDDTLMMTLTVTSNTAVDAGSDVSICFGDTVQLGGSGGVTFAWSPNTNIDDSTLSNPEVWPVDTTDYILTAYDVDGCPGFDTVKVSIYQLLNNSLVDSIDFCKGDSVQVNVNDGVSFVWDNPTDMDDNTIINPYMKPSDSTLFHVTITDAFGCVYLDSVQVNVDPLPVVTIGSDFDMCIEDTVQLNGSVVPGGTYAWNTETGLSDSTISNPLTFITVTSQYILVVTDTNGCVNSDTLDITVNPLPVANAGLDSSICLTDTLQLLATGGVNYLWSPTTNLSANNVADPFANPDTTITYYVTVTDVNACSNLDSILIVVDSLPDPQLVDYAQFCDGDSVQLILNPGMTYLWSPAAGLSDPTSSAPYAHPLDTTTYYVTVTDGEQCSKSDSVIVQFNPLPIVSAGADFDMCIFDVNTLNGSGPAGALFNWSTATGLDDSTLANPTVFVTVTTTYILEVTDTNGCVNSDTVVVTINPLPIADAGLDSSICINDEVQLFASGGTGYSWGPNVDLTATNVFNPTATPTDSITYYVTVTDVNNCTQVDSVYIEVDPLPTIVLSSDSIKYCFGEGLNVTVSGGDVYAWAPNDQIDDSTLAVPYIGALVDTVYTVWVTDSNLCVDKDSVQVIVYDLPAVNAGTDVQICDGDSTQLTASGAVDYAWVGVSMSDTAIANPWVNPTDTVDYIVFGTDANNCVQSDTVTVVRNYLPVISAGLDTTICLGDTIAIGGAPTGPAGATFAWNTEVLLSDSTLENPEVSPNDTTSYWVLVTDTNGCQSTDTVIVNTFDLPLVSAGVDEWLCPGIQINLEATGADTYSWSDADSLVNPLTATPTTNVLDTNIFIVIGVDTNTCVNQDTMIVYVNDLVPTDAGPDTTICLLDSVQLGGNPSAPDGTIFTWSPAGGLDDAAVANPMASPANSQWYYLNTQNDTCFGIDSVFVTVNPLPIPSAGIDREICVGDSTQLLPSGGVTYLWSPSGSLSNDTLDPWALPLDTTMYHVTVTDANGCVETDSVEITVNQLPNITVTGDTAICLLESLQLNISGAETYAWGPNIYLNDSSSASPITTPDNSIMYAVFAVDSNGCLATESVSITVNDLPNTFAGNDTSLCLNDTISLQATGGTSYAWSTTTSLSDTSIASPDAYPSADETFYVLATDDNGCVRMDTVDVTVFALPSVDAGTDVQICLDDTVQLTPSGATSYLWTGDSLLSDTASPFVNPTDTTLYYVTGTDDNGCQWTDSVEVIVNPYPSVDITDSLTVCRGSSAVLTPTGAQVYSWTPSDDLNGTTGTVLTTPEISREYFVTGVDTNGCVNTDSIQVYVFRVDALGDTVVCSQSIIDAAVFSNGSDQTYIWSPNTNISSTTVGQVNISLTEPGAFIYQVEVSDSSGCTDVDSVTIEVQVKPTSQFDVSFEPGCETLTGTFVNLSDDADSYQWLVNGTDAYATEALTLTVEYGAPIDVQLISSNEDCIDTSDVSVNIQSLNDYLEVEGTNVFSPNGDGLNDVFTIDFNHDVSECSELIVYNRWGQLVFRSAPGANAWDGTNTSGNIVPEGTYYYVFVVGAVEVNGSVTVYH